MGEKRFKGVRIIEFLLYVFAIIATVSAASSLTYLDWIVHNQLYSYGLQFSYDWADPYWTTLRLVFLLLGFVVTSIVGMIYVYGRERIKTEIREKFIKEKLPNLVTADKAEKADKMENVDKAENVSLSDQSLYKCGSCGRSFRQPLKMLDLSSAEIKTVELCPFCNEALTPIKRLTTPEQKQEK